MTNNIIAEINNPTSTSFISSTFSQISQTSGFLPFSSSLENLTELIKQTKLNAQPQEEEEDEDEEEEEEGGGKKKKKLKKDEKGEGGKEKQEEIDMAIHPSGIVPTLQNIVSTVNLGCKLDLKKNCSACTKCGIQSKAVRSSNHAYPRSQNNVAYLCVWQNGVHGSQE